MPLVEIELEAGARVEATPLPAAARELLAAARSRIAAYYERGGGGELPGFVPSDYEAVHAALAALRAVRGEAGRFCEWGSGFGVVAGLAAQLGYDAHGIEIDAELVGASRELLRAHGLDVEIAHGTFVPPEFVDADRWIDLESPTVAHGDDAYAELGLDLDDFGVVFAYPWPGEEELFHRMFDRFGDAGAVLLLWTRSDGVRAFRRGR
ncbi:MAG: hypothetical protein AB7O97_05805 [Planctomycetota bacterium]